MSLEDFAQSHHLDRRWIELRSQSNHIVGQPDFWCRKNGERAQRFGTPPSATVSALCLSRLLAPAEPLPEALQ